MWEKTEYGFERVPTQAHIKMFHPSTISSAISREFHDTREVTQSCAGCPEERQPRWDRTLTIHRRSTTCLVATLKLFNEFLIQLVCKSNVVELAALDTFPQCYVPHWVYSKVLPGYIRRYCSGYTHIFEGTTMDI